MSKPLSGCPAKHFGEFNYFEKELGFERSFLALEERKFLTFGEVFRQDCQNCLLCVQRDISKKLFTLEGHFFFYFFGFQHKISCSCHNCMVHVQRKILRKKIFLIKFCFCIFFRTLSGNILHCRRIFCRRCVNCTLGVQRNLLEKIVSLRENSDFNEVFLHLKKESFRLLVKFSVKILKTAFYVSRRICWRKIFSTERNSVFIFLSEFGRKFFCRVVKTAFYMFRKTNREKIFVLRKTLFLSFDFRTSSEKLPAEL